MSSVTAEPDVLNLKWRREGNKLLLLPAVEEVRHSGGVGRPPLVDSGCGRRRQGLRELLTHTKCGIQQQSLSPLPRSTLHPSALPLHFKSKSLTLPLPRQFPPRESRALLLFSSSLFCDPLPSRSRSIGVMSFRSFLLFFPLALSSPPVNRSPPPSVG